MQGIDRMQPGIEFLFFPVFIPIIFLPINSALNCDENPVAAFELIQNKNPKQNFL